MMDFAIPAELDEILALCDEVVVMYEGRFVAHLDPTMCDEREIGRHMLGLSNDEDSPETGP